MWSDILFYTLALLVHSKRFEVCLISTEGNLKVERLTGSNRGEDKRVNKGLGCKIASQFWRLLRIDEKSNVLLVPLTHFIQFLLHCFDCPLVCLNCCFVQWVRRLLVWTQNSSRFGSDLPCSWWEDKTGESSDPCGRPSVGWSGAELQFSMCVACTVVSRSAPITRQVSVRSGLAWL